MKIYCRKFWVVCIGICAGWMGISLSSAFADLSGASYRIENGNFAFFQNNEMQGAQFKVESDGADSSTARLPVIQSAEPTGLARFFANETLAYTVTARDPDGGSLAYQLRQDGTVKIPFQAANILSRELSTADKGRHTVKLEVRDSAAAPGGGTDGTVATSREMYVLRKPLK